jgi:AGCS family alanine or glycine:cation symporter
MDLLVPIMAALHIVGALIVIIANIGNLIPATGSIFAYAFRPVAAVGGFAGSTVALCIRWGAARGVYSNEAGFGTAPAAHSSADVDHPIRQACWGIFEVTVDTLVVCTVTALAVLTTGAWQVEGVQSGALAQYAFSSVFGGFGNYFVAICVFLFVFSTIVVLFYYGQRQAEFLFGVKFSKIWVWVYPVFMIVAAMGAELTLMYMVTDGFLGLIIIPNMIACVALVGQVKKLQDEYFNTPDQYYLADKAAKAAKKAK